MAEAKSPVTLMVANPTFPQEGGVTVGSVLNTNEWGVIDSLAAGAQTWVSSGGRETETDRLRNRDTRRDRKRPTSG